MEIIERFVGNFIYKWKDDLADWPSASFVSSIILPFVVSQYLGGTKEYKSVNQFIEQKEVSAFFVQVSIMEFYLSVYGVWEEDQYLLFMPYCRYKHEQFSTDCTLLWKDLKLSLNNGFSAVLIRLSFVCHCHRVGR